jgi:hemerythrin
MQIEAIQQAHDAIEHLLKGLESSIVQGASRHTALEILKTSIEVCKAHFADEEARMRESGQLSVGIHAAVHKQLLTKFERAHLLGRSREGLPMAILDAVKLLHVFREHVDAYNHSSEAVAFAWAPSVH